jgi:dipeptidyl aminopeptidase/acylaminoacyl peptidase
MKTFRKAFIAGFCAALWLAAGAAGQTAAQQPFSIEQILAYSFSYELASANKADRIAWFEFEQGRRNVFTAASPDFKPVRLTSFMDDDGTDLTSLGISDDGAVVVFVRGHDPNSKGWNANPSQFPDGSEQAIWAVRAREGKPFRLAAGSQPALSPDGKWVTFVREGQVFGVAVPPSAPAKPAGGRTAGRNAKEELAPLFRTWGTNSAPVWSPDSRRIAFVTDRQDHGFIGVYDLAGRKITYLAPSVDRDTSPSWSGDGRKIAFVRRPGSAFAQILAQVQNSPGGPSYRPAVPAAPPVAPGIAAPPSAPPAGAPAPTPVPGPQPAASPGFQASKFADGHLLTFWVADVEKGTAEKVWHDPVDDPAWRAVRTVKWAGDSLVFMVERNNWQHYYAVPAAGPADSAPVDLTPGDGEAEFVAYSADGRTLFYTSNAGDIDRRDLWKTPTAGGPPVQLTRGDGLETEPAPLASGTQVAVFYADARRPRCVALVPAQGGEAKIVNPALPAGFPLDAQVVPEAVLLKAEDGLEFHTQVFVPKDIKPGERRPAILFTHGGPGRQMLLGYHYMFFYHMAYAMNQYFASRGYVVISVNYRSGIGYGRAFRMAPGRGAAGSSEYQDVVAAGRYLQSRPDVDPERIGLYGLSYGGLLTAMGLSRNSDIFKAGVDIAGVHLWGNSIDTNSTAFKASAVATVDKWTSPVLLVQGDDDRNVAFSQTTGLVQLLRARNIYHELIVFPDEVHDFLVYAKWIKTFKAADDFFGRFLRK